MLKMKKKSVIAILLCISLCGCNVNTNTNPVETEIVTVTDGEGGIVTSVTPHTEANTDKGNPAASLREGLSEFADKYEGTEGTGDFN